MGEIKKYDETSNMFGGRGLPRNRDTREVKLLKPGEYWSEEHFCYVEPASCAKRNRLTTAAHRWFGKGGYSVMHTGGMIGVLRKGDNDGSSD